jgi:hypothetical protein
MTEADRIIEEVRRSRCRMSEQCGHDVARLVRLLSDFNHRYDAQVKKYQESKRAATGRVAGKTGMKTRRSAAKRGRATSSGKRSS